MHGENKKGLALDIDETLSWTIGYWVEDFIKRFGNPENLTTKEIVAKYRYSHHIPYWQTPEVQERRKELTYSDSVQEELPLIENANHIVEKINKIVPIKLYLTARPTIVGNGTSKWLKTHGFPDAEITYRPEEVPHADSSKWKAQILQKLYPSIVGIIDDNPGLAEALPGDYKGVFFLYDYHEAPRNDIKVIPCPSWDDVYSAVVGEFNK